MRKLIAILAILGLLTSLTATSVTARRPGDRTNEPRHRDHDLSAPQIDKQRAMTARAQELVLSGERRARGDNKVVRIAKGQYVELARVGEDAILTVLGEFGSGDATHQHQLDDDDELETVTHTGPDGPLHNQIPEPDRSVDNTTIWTEDFSEAYFEDLLFSEAPGDVSMRNYYLEQSSGRYTVHGDVSPWVQVPNNAASYGSNYCGDIVCQDTWRFVNDSADAFAANFANKAALNSYLAQYDIWDRYDIDGDGNFDEPDGYIDHYQSVHAGEGEETGGGAQGEDAIWSHRWYAYFGANGPDGPGVDGWGGVRIGNSDYWIGDYTIEPENGGVGVFAHEFAHDYNIPDLYDTSGNVGGAENSTGFWTLMSSGTYGSSGRPEDGIGSKPVHMGNWEKFQMGWLNYEVAFAGVPSGHRLGPAEYNTKQAQGVFIVLPDNVVPLELGPPCTGCGERFFWGNIGHNLNTSMSRSISGGGALTAKVRYDIELDWDYAFLEASTNGGTTWQPVLTNRSQTNSDGQSGFNTSRTGITGDTDGQWVDLTATIPAGANAVRFRYRTDGAVAEPGFQVDNIAIGGTVIGTAEAGETGWTLNGFVTTSGSEEQHFFNAYVLENRQYIGYDRSLKTGPYNFGFLNTKPNWVEHFAYQDGLLINYWNTEWTDNNVGDHPGEGLLLPVDAHPQFSHWDDGTLMRPRILTFDSTFGLDRVPALTLHNNGVAATIPAKPAVPVFRDSRDYWFNCDEHACTGEHDGRYQPGWYSVDVPNTGTKVRVKSVSSTGFMQVDINK
ncbi:MAG TPA: immune inhibitor A domain-containing protein [Candidatus Limnocylindria bacterium]|nr:immune inhibitor A domain-containing protein [Candidatus Limnocylindria bacterium]